MQLKRVPPARKQHVEKSPSKTLSAVKPKFSRLGLHYQILISELSHATAKSEEDVEVMIDDVLDGAHGVKLAAQA